MRIWFIVLVLMLPTQLTLWHLPSLVVWNVGQGQWVTFRENNFCLHLDMGGERYPASLVERHCRQLSNILIVSHWDRDHINFISAARKTLSNLCLYDSPLIPSSMNSRARGWRRKIAVALRELQPCNDKQIKFTLSYFKLIYRPPHETKSNEQSLIKLISDRILIPGDSTRRQELIWARKSEHQLQGVTTLVLGHHGSKTSTSEELLNRLPHTLVAIASARKRRYGHPHPEVLARLKRFGIATLTTETWSHIQLFL